MDIDLNEFYNAIEVLKRRQKVIEKRNLRQQVVYIIFFKTPGKLYVGKSIDHMRRLRNHMRGNCPNFKDALNTYGKEDTVVFTLNT